MEPVSVFGLDFYSVGTCVWKIVFYFIFGLYLSRKCDNHSKKTYNLISTNDEVYQFIKTVDLDVSLRKFNTTTTTTFYLLD